MKSKQSAILNLEMKLTPGAVLGPYQISAAIGAGGMGEVYRARDTRLGREVALKFLPQDLSGDRHGLARFEREARSSSSLNHPNIITVHDFHADAEQAYLVMELIRGESLREVIARGPLPQKKLFDIASGIAEGLAAAHEAGIIHRDLKPENVMITEEGTPKILDFGLARPAVESLPPDAATEVRLTGTGIVLGTLPYMAPEQARGDRIGIQCDQFALGLILFEMATGRHAFRRGSAYETVTAILREDAPAIGDSLPEMFGWIVERCLAKDPRERYASTADLARDLSALRDRGGALRPAIRETAAPDVQPARSAPSRSLRVWQGLAVLMAALALWKGAWLWPATTGSPGRLSALVPDNVTPDDISVSPDGRKLVFAAVEGGLWMRELGELEWRVLPGTEGASTPFWSPDSRYLGFIVDDAIRKIDTQSGPAETVATIGAAAPRSGAWNRSGDIVLGSWRGGPGGPIWRVSAAGGTATAVTQVDRSSGEFVHAWPTFLPDGRHFLYFRSGSPDIEGMYVGSLDVDPGSQSRERILATDVPAVFADGHLFFPRAGTLMVQPFDARRLELRDAPVSVAQDVAITWYATGKFSVSEAGVFVYEGASTPGAVQLTWVDRQGAALGTLGSPGNDRRVVLSPDGTRAVAKDSPYNVPGDLWMLDLAAGRRTRFTFKRDVYSDPVWSPDGTHIAYSAGRLGDTILEKASSGLGEARVLLSTPGLRNFPTSWSRDGRFLLYHTENAADTGYDLWALSLVDRKPHLMLGGAFNEWAGVFSPDMRWVAHVSLESGPPEVYVRPFRVSEATGQPSFGAGQWQVSKERGNWPQWRTDHEIVFNTAPSGTEAFSVSVNTTDTAFESGAPLLLPFPPTTGVSTTPQSTPDGERFLIEVAGDQRATQAAIDVVLNWPALLHQQNRRSN